MNLSSESSSLQMESSSEIGPSVHLGSFELESSPQPDNSEAGSSHLLGLCPDTGIFSSAGSFH